MATSTYTTSCTKCNFAPFCLTEEHDQSWANEVNLLVKQYRTLKRKEVLCLPNNKFRSLYAIQTGALKTYQTEADGKELIRGFYFGGEMLGYEAISTGQYTFSAVALSETLICEIPYDDFLEFLHAKPALQKHILHLISQQLNVGAYLVSSTAEQRLAAFLIDLSSRLHPAIMKLDFILPMSRQDIGNYLRLTAETISRILSQLQKNKVVAIHHKRVQILDIASLKRIADGLLSLSFR